MKKFRFQFETLERVRQQQQNVALRALGEAQRAFQAALSHKQGLLQQLADSLLRRENLGREPVSGVAFQTETDFVQGTKHRIVHADQAIVRASRGVEKALRAYLAARRNTKMMESLREKAYAEWKKQRARFEQKQTEDLYVMRNRLEEGRSDVA